MGLQPLEYSECYLDSPEFRENIHAHEAELERTNKAIKDLIRDSKALLAAARNLSKAQRTFSDSLINFNFECIGTSQTDDEVDISQSLKEFGRLIANIEDERDRMLEHAKDQLISPLENFRKTQIGGAKESRKVFERQTEKFCASVDKHVALTTKKKEASLQDADAALEMERRQFHRDSLHYVFKLQEVQEKKKFEFVETLLGFMYSWLTFYHQGHEVSTEFKPYMTELQLKLQHIRAGFDATRHEAETLMHKMLEKPTDHRKSSKQYEGYLYVYEKRAIGSNWVKHYCRYWKDTKNMRMAAYNQTLPKVIQEEVITVTSCTRRMTDSIEKRFCFDVTCMERPNVVTFQAVSEDERNVWMDAMGGKEPIYLNPAQISKSNDNLLNDIGFNFIRKCIEAIESRGLEDQGLYRVVGVNSKVQRLTSLCLGTVSERRKPQNVNLSDSGEWEIKTITSALKNYFRNLPEPLMTYRLHDEFLLAAKQETKTLRLNDIHHLIHSLPEPNKEILDMLCAHLSKVASYSNINLMTVANLGVCFGPTLMRPEEETMKAIMDIKFANIIVEMLITHYEKIFKTTPEGMPYRVTKPYNPSTVLSNSGSSSSSASSTSSAKASPRNSKPTPQQQPLQPADFKMQQRFTPQSQSPVIGMRDHSPRRTVVEPQYSSSSSRESISSQSSISTHSSNSSPPSSKKSSNSLSTVFWRSIQMRKYPKYHTYHGNKNRHSYDGSKTPPSGLEDPNITPPSIRSSYRPPIEIARKGFIISEPGSPKIEHRMPINTCPPDKATNLRPPLARPDEIDNHDMPIVRDKTSSTSSSTSSSSASQLNSLESGFVPGVGEITKLLDPKPGAKSTPDKKGICVRTLYACDADNESELSFSANQIIVNVRASKERGWLLGTLNGKTGLIPENYVEPLSLQE
ncbi:rho GTPase-activating protein 26-like isoform X3 [Amphiura filiformis]|uniref:rho GTPase-activating protein 26-like isoform X3 n=1 Tax=Amphiura filiformis TaxID=82378 RepID=UPI003B20BCF6